MAQTGERIDPYLAFNFLVELDGIAQASFRECSGLSSTTEVIETREGGDNTTVRKLPGKTTYSDITLKWGLTASDELWQWRREVTQGAFTRRNGSVVVFDLSNHHEVARWNFVAAWPTKWDGPAFNATGNEIAVETLVLAHEGITRA
ncbi:phage tail protein [Pseudonocardia endophytica]|uniref:Phage tail-like protein n=1 Tax=Pseudonocardia endophytica TaxID=401976 RepID=A0A4R1HKE7_PSEEN|nr:phage tail protein [Pseudonocardia endophytica]TCK22874.1 phage tail-like protein [Pseudonocardia endophytica]